MNRRKFLQQTIWTAAVAPMALSGAPAAHAEPVIDIHQHTNYSGRTDEQLIAHQRTMGITRTILLPAGSKYGLEAGCGGNETVQNVSRQLPKEFVYFANEVTELAEASEVIRGFLKSGAIGIGEQKFKVNCDSPEFQRLAALAQEFHVPILMHFQHETYNTGIERFHKVLEKFPKVNFIGHAQTWWGNIDKAHEQSILYPTTPVQPGGITDRLLSDYPNMYGDMSAGSGLNALTRDEEQATHFLRRHQDKLMYGSDCNDVFGHGNGCTGAQILAAIRRLSPNKSVERKILYRNAQRVMKVKV